MFASAQALASHKRSKKHHGKTEVRPAVRLEFAALPWYMMPSALANVVSLFEAPRLESATGEAQSSDGKKRRKQSRANRERPTTTKHRGPGFAAEMVRLVQEKKQAGEKRIIN